MAELFNFEMTATDGKARTGVIHTPRGDIRTPAFMPVGTAATVKAMMPESVRATGADILLGNTYHLMLRPTAERIDRLGGLHKFMNGRPIPTDSGGFRRCRWRTGKLTRRDLQILHRWLGHELTPERLMEIQALLGSDIVMCFDECPALPADRDRIAESMRLPMRWRNARARPLVIDRAMRSLAFSRVAWNRISAPRAPKPSPRSALTATPLAALRWAKDKRRCLAVWIMRPTCCPWTSRAT